MSHVADDDNSDIRDAVNMPVVHRTLGSWRAQVDLGGEKTNANESPKTALDLEEG